MRLFIAFDIPEGIIKKLVFVQKQIKADAKITWVDAKNMHMTLKFLGEVNEDKVNDVKKRLGKVAFNKFDAELSGIGVFPSENYIRVIWVGFKDEKQMKELAKSINEQLPEFKDEYEFKAHLTIGRVRFVRDREELAGQAKKIKIKPGILCSK